MKKIITGLFAIAAFTFSASAQTTDNTTRDKDWKKDRHEMHQRHDGKGMIGLEKLNLTESQKQQMQSLNQDFKTRMQTLNGNDNLLVKDQRAQRKALMQERKEKMNAILTPEQRNQLAQMHKDGKKQGDWKNKTKGEDGKQKRKVEDGKEKIKIKTT